nr:hypothetical protein GCM10020092_053290 [Actinoplanes digitatis]
MSANGSGSLRIGVRLDSGAVRSTTAMDPPLIPATSACRMLIEPPHFATIIDDSASLCHSRPRSCSDSRRSPRSPRQGEPGVEPQESAVPFGGLAEGVDLCGRQGPVGQQVEAHVVGG